MRVSILAAILPLALANFSHPDNCCDAFAYQVIEQALNAWPQGQAFCSSHFPLSPAVKTSTASAAKVTSTTVKYVTVTSTAPAVTQTVTVSTTTSISTIVVETDTLTSSTLVATVGIFTPGQGPATTSTTTNSPPASPTVAPRDNPQPGLPARIKSAAAADLSTACSCLEKRPTKTTILTPTQTVSLTATSFTTSTITQTSTSDAILTSQETTRISTTTTSTSTSTTYSYTATATPTCSTLAVAAFVETDDYQIIYSGTRTLNPNSPANEGGPISSSIPGNQDVCTAAQTCAEYANFNGYYTINLQWLTASQSYNCVGYARPASSGDFDVETAGVGGSYGWTDSADAGVEL